MCQKSKETDDQCNRGFWTAVRPPEGPGPRARALGPAKLLNEFVSQRSYFLLASLNYLMNLFLGGDISERICQSSITPDHADNYFSELLLFWRSTLFYENIKVPHRNSLH